MEKLKQRHWLLQNNKWSLPYKKESAKALFFMLKIWMRIIEVCLRIH
jgi:flagellar biosynthesis regulator FlaF